jgi:hypothetical protein
MRAVVTPTNKQWAIRHNNAIDFCTLSNVEKPVRDMLISWDAYARQHQARYESLIGEDYVLGPTWASIGESIRTLLNGECGRLDCGTLDSFILKTLEANGINTENL